MIPIPEFKDSDFTLCRRILRISVYQLSPHHFIHFRVKVGIYKGGTGSFRNLTGPRVLVMFRLHSSLLVFCSILVAVSYATLIPTLRNSNIAVLAPGNAGYSNSSTACKSFDLFLSYPAMILKFFIIVQLIYVLLLSLQQLHFQTTHRMYPLS